MDDLSTLIQAVESFQDTQDPLSDDLERFISHIARTGDTLVSWEKVQKVFMNKLQLVLDDFYKTAPYKVGKMNANATNDDFEEMKKRLLQLTEEFDSPPFTIQRLCELLTEPRKNYTKCDKFMRGLEKNLMVVSSWNNLPRRTVDDNENMMNGVNPGPSNGFVSAERLKPHWTNLPPSPVSTTPPKIPGAPNFSAVSSPKQEPGPEEQEEGDTAHSKDSLVTATESETTKEDAEDATDENERKSNVSATIISSSPPKTINIKRKIDDSADDNLESIEKEPIKTEIEQSPTKRIKSDSCEGNVKEEKHDVDSSSSAEVQEKRDSAEVVSGGCGKAAESGRIDDSPKQNADSAETPNQQTADSNESQSKRIPETAPPSDAKMDTTDSYTPKEGTSVDPPTEKTDDSQMDVD